MFRELVDLGRDLDDKGVLPSVGFYYYGQPIKWVVHLWPDKVYLEAAELDKSRPYSGRTSDVQAHLLADEAGYALGASKDKSGAGDKRAASKHEAFRQLVRKFLSWRGLQNSEVREAIGWLESALDEGLIQADPRYGEILTKDWVSFVPEVGPLASEHLFEHPEARAFWAYELEQRSLPYKGKKLVLGTCSSCGTQGSLMGKIPKVKLASNAPLHSYNADSFVSYISGLKAFEKANVSLCFTCGDTAARAFNYLSNSDKHKKSLVWDKDKRDSLVNQTALFWLKSKKDSKLEIGGATFGMDDLIASVGTALTDKRSKEGVPPASETQLTALLDLPWKPKEAGLTLDDFGFNLGILSPNVGRIALREWISISLSTLKKNLGAFREGTRIVSSWGDIAAPQSIYQLLAAADIKNPNFNRSLIRSAFLGYQPPFGLLEAAVRKIRNPRILNPKTLQDRQESWRLQPLASAIKLVLTFEQEENMEELNPKSKTQAYLCGRLLAILEEAQLRASNFGINTTLVDRFYGSASIAPASVFGNLLRLATTAHLPKVGKVMNELTEEVMSLLDELGGFPTTLGLAQQAEFALGFYHQRAKFRASRGKNNSQEATA